MPKRILTSALAAVFALSNIVLASPAYAAKKPKAPAVEMPHCAKSLGKVVVIEPTTPQGGNAQWWTQMNLGSPIPIIESYITESGCYTLVGRSDSGYTSERDRRLAAAGVLQVSKKPKGVADFIIVPNLVYDNGNKSQASGMASMGLSMVVPMAGLATSFFKTKKDKAEVTLSVTDRRSSGADDVVFVGSSSKRSVAMYYSGLYPSDSAPTSVADYEKTKEGKLILAASLDAFTKMVIGHGGVITAPSTPASVSEQVAVAEEAPRIPFTTSSKVNMREGPAATEKVLQLLAAGTVLHPTGREAQGWIEVQTDAQQKGWVMKALLTAG